MPWAILITLSISDLINSAVVGYLIYKIHNTQVQHAQAFPYEATAPEADIEMIHSMNEKAF